MNQSELEGRTVIEYNDKNAAFIRDKIAKESGIAQDVASLLLEKQHMLTLRLLREQRKFGIDAVIAGLIDCNIEPSVELVWNTLMNVNHNLLLNTIESAPNEISLVEWKQQILSDIERMFNNAIGKQKSGRA